MTSCPWTKSRWRLPSALAFAIVYQPDFDTPHPEGFQDACNEAAEDQYDKEKHKQQDKHGSKHIFSLEQGRVIDDACAACEKCLHGLGERFEPVQVEETGVYIESEGG